MHENKTYETKTLQFQEFDHVFQSAQLRRSADLGLWLREYFAARRARLEEEAKSLNTATTLRRQAV
jgi:hypothetical protein